MAITTKLYGLVFTSAFNKEIDFNSDTLKVSLHTSSYTPNQDTHQYWDISVTSQIAGGGYTAGGATVTGLVDYNVGTNIFKLDCTDITSSWTGNSVTNARYAVLYDSTPVSNKPLIAYVDFGEDLQVLSLTFNPNGLVTVAVPA